MYYQRTSTFRGSFANDIFEESVQMSTYLVAFIISDLKSVGNGSIKVWTRGDAIDQAKYALSIGTKSLEFLEFTFGQKYQIKKLDMVALPKSHFGGMENWGLITYRESALLYDEEESSDVIQQSVAAVIAHECTHMWFGNLVTPDWWGFLWLSEGFARYYQFKAFSQVCFNANFEFELKFGLKNCLNVNQTEDFDFRLNQHGEWINNLCLDSKMPFLSIHYLLQHHFLDLFITNQISLIWQMAFLTTKGPV